ncbi:c-type cytochrome, partial [Daejeonella sp.]|uniref:c-type cytochrome n=1 Tax=Daejeonella sp. TaxID=2805397 RepID=UPI0030C416D4
MSDNSNSNPIRQKAAEMIGKSRSGEDKALELLRNQKVAAEYIPPVVAGLKAARRKAVYNEALTFLPGAARTVNQNEVPSLSDLLAITGNNENGAAVFKRFCFVCHQVSDEGFDFGPKLTEIGSKLPKEGLLDAIVRPSAGISFGYETWQIDMKDGSTLTGIIASRTENEVEMKYPGGAIQKIKTNDVKSTRKLTESTMPEGLHESLTKQELADLIQYLSLLKKKG